MKDKIIKEVYKTGSYSYKNTVSFDICGCLEVIDEPGSLSKIII
jgi:hypothetical protein